LGQNSETTLLCLRRTTLAARWARVVIVFGAVLTMRGASSAAAQVLNIEPDGSSRLVCTSIPAPSAAARPRALPPAYAKAMERAAEDFAVSMDLLDAVAWQESRYNPAALSPKGAIGLMQLMPATARTFGVDPYDPEQNIRGGAAYLRYLLDVFDGRIDLVLGGYNAGQKAIQRYGGLPPYAETQAFVANNFASLAAKSEHGTAAAASTSASYFQSCR